MAARALALRGYGARLGQTVRRWLQAEARSDPTGTLHQTLLSGRVVAALHSRSLCPMSRDAPPPPPHEREPHGAQGAAKVRQEPAGAVKSWAPSKSFLQKLSGKGARKLHRRELERGWNKGRGRSSGGEAAPSMMGDLKAQQQTRITRWLLERETLQDEEQRLAALKRNMQINRMLIDVESPRALLEMGTLLADSFNAVNWSTFYYHLGLFARTAAGSKHDWEAEPALQELRRTHLLAQIPKFRSHAMANVLWAHAVLRLNLTPLELEAVGANLLKTAANFSPQGISMVLWSLATMNQHPGEAVMAAIDRAVCAKLFEFEDQGISNTLWAWATLNHQPAADCTVPCQNIRAFMKSQKMSVSLDKHQRLTPMPVAQGGPWEISEDLPLLKAMPVLMMQLMPRFRAQVVSNSLWAFAVLKHHPGLMLLKKCDHVMTNLHHEEPNSQHISNILWAHAVLGYRSSERFLRMVKQHGDSKLHTYTPQGLAILIWSLGYLRKLGVNLPEIIPTTWFDKVNKHVMPRLSDFTTNSLGSMFHGFANNTYKPTGAFSDALEREIVHRLRTDDMSFQGVHNIVWAMAVLDYAPSDTAWAALEKKLLEVSEEHNLMSGTMFSTSFNLRNKQHAVYADGLNWQEANVECINQIVHAHLICCLGAPNADIEPEIRSKLYKVCHERTQAQALLSNSVITTFHENVSKALMDLGVAHELEVMDDLGIRALDIVLTDHPKVCVQDKLSTDLLGAARVRCGEQVDGPLHFTCNTLEVLGPTRARDELMRAQGWKVISVPYFDWCKANTGDEGKSQRLWLQNILIESGVPLHADESAGTSRA